MVVISSRYQETRPSYGPDYNKVKKRQTSKITVKTLKTGKPEKFVVNTLKFEQGGFTVE